MFSQDHLFTLLLQSVDQQLSLTSVKMLEAPLGVSKTDPFIHPVVVLIPYASIISKSASTGVNISQLSNFPSLLTGMVRFLCLSAVRFGPRCKIQSVLQWCGKLMPTKTWLMTSKATKTLGIHNIATKRFWNKPNAPISSRICLKLLMLLSGCPHREMSCSEEHQAPESQLSCRPAS